jgi:L-asparaginase
LNNITILNTGGTFNKVYDPILGKLTVPKHNNAIKTIFNNFMKSNTKPIFKGVLFKDSLDITNKDRKKIISKINKIKSNQIIIIHGTDTIDLTAKYIQKRVNNKIIILTGAMQPFSIEPIEATANLISAYGFIQNCKKNGVYIAMNGYIKPFKKIAKNKDIGVFQCQK